MSEIAKSVESCDDNEKFAEAAVLCLESLEAQVSAASGRLTQAMQAHQGGKQDQSLGSAKADYQLSQQTLDLLLAQTEASAREILGYTRAVVFPEDFDSDEAVGNDVEAFLRREPCFTETHDILDSVLADLKRHHESLEAARGVSSAHRQGAATSQKNIELRAGTKVLKKQQVGGYEQGIDGSRSGVSGMEKLKK